MILSKVSRFIEQRLKSGPEMKKSNTMKNSSPVMYIELGTETTKKRGKKSSVLRHVAHSTKKFLHISFPQY